MQLMLDLETLDTKPSAIVLSIGAVLFNQSGIHSEFYTELNFETQLLAKRTQSQSTLNWWLNQQAGRKFNLPSEDYGYQLKEFLNWLKNEMVFYNPADFRIWGNGSTMDVSIIEDLLCSAGLSIPYHYWQIRDLRTFRELVADVEKIDESYYEGEKHNALTDAKAQAKYVIYHMRRTGRWATPVDTDIPF